jgi:CRISPR/Cas system-associated exonuclease Cas4 (RecB family)
VALEDFRGLEQSKQIRIFELPSDVLQAKTVHRILEMKKNDQPQECTETAVVLCDEELLMPLMMSLPDTPEDINVTMGYPMKNTPAYGFVDSILRLQHNSRRSREGVDQFYHKDVTSILLHPYMRRADLSGDHPLLHEIVRSNLILVDQTFFSEPLELKLFRRVEGAGGLLHYLKEVFQLMLEHVAVQSEKQLQELDREFIFQLLILINKLELLVESKPHLTREMLERLFRKMLSGIRIPFEGEPLSGLQVMGILETRLLDFKHVILLSMNEEVIPAPHTGQSYIPYAMRLAFHMPAREEMDAIYAYYFHRLLQRAEQVDLLYNSNSEGIRTGEMSRYLYQLRFERGVEVIRPGMEVKSVATESIVITHSELISRKLENYMFYEGSEKYLSPSAINTYMDCSLKFYLRYLAGIGEPDEVQEDIDPAGFGTVVHESIRLLYTRMAGSDHGIISQAALNRMLKSDQPEEVLRQTFSDHHFKGRKGGSIDGRNIIIFRVMLKYLQKIISTDADIAPFQLVSAERSYKRKIHISLENNQLDIHLGGKIDRIDRVGDLLRVIDYKTGEARQGFPHLEALFDTSQRNRNSAAFQTLFYAWLVEPEHPGEQILPGLYIMKALYGEHFDPALTMGRNQDRKRVDNFSELKEPYISLLKQVLLHLFDPSVPFVQTDNEAKCRYCDFAKICNRTAID